MPNYLMGQRLCVEKFPAPSFLQTEARVLEVETSHESRGLGTILGLGLAKSTLNTGHILGVHSSHLKFAPQM